MRFNRFGIFPATCPSSLCIDTAFLAAESPARSTKTKPEKTDLNLLSVPVTASLHRQHVGLAGQLILLMLTQHQIGHTLCPCHCRKGRSAMYDRSPPSSARHLCWLDGRCIPACEKCMSSPQLVRNFPDALHLSGIRGFDEAFTLFSLWQAMQQGRIVAFIRLSFNVPFSNFTFMDAPSPQPPGPSLTAEDTSARYLQLPQGRLYT